MRSRGPHRAGERMLRKEGPIHGRLQEECGKVLREVGLDDFRPPPAS